MILLKSLGVVSIVNILRFVHLVIRIDENLNQRKILLTIYGKKGFQTIQLYRTIYYYVKNRKLPISKYLVIDAVERADFSNSNLSATHIVEICDYLRKCPTLQSLSLSNTLMKRFNLALFSSFFKTLEHQSFRCLNLSRNGIHNNELLGNVIGSDCRTKLKQLYLCEVQFTIEDMKAFSDLMIENKSLEKLSLMRISKIGPKRMSQLSDFLRINSTLRVLDLRNCYIYFKACRSLFFNLKYNISVEELLLGGNRVDFEDGEILYDLCTYNNSIRILDLSSNYLKDAGELLLSVFEDGMGGIKSINFDNTQIEMVYYHKICKYLVPDLARIRKYSYPNRICEVVETFV